MNQCHAGAVRAHSESFQLFDMLRVFKPQQLLQFSYDSVKKKAKKKSSIFRFNTHFYFSIAMLIKLQTSEVHSFSKHPYLIRIKSKPF